MARAPIPTSGGTRQQRAAELRAEDERKKRGAAQEEATAPTDDPDDDRDDSSSTAEGANASQDTGAIGQGEYIVKQGDCISAIACRYGFFWKTLWELSENSELNSVREDPNVLLPGDRITIPELRQKEESGATEAHHRFRRLGEPSKLRLRLMKEPDGEGDEAPGEIIEKERGKNHITEDAETSQEPTADEPRANVPYALVIDGTHHDGTTDEDGWIEVSIPGSARRGKLILNPGTEQEEELSLQLGHLSPISEIRGVKERLANLGLDCGDRTSAVTDGLRWAVKAFQIKQGQEPTGELTEALGLKIQELHGS